MNKSTRYVVFAFLFVVAGYGVYSLMNKTTASDTSATTAVADSSNTEVAVAQADMPDQAGLMGKEGEAKPEEVKKEGEVAPEEMKKEGEETDEEPVLEEETEEVEEEVAK